MSKYKNPIRIVTAAALYDGHDVSINIMRRVLQSMGVEVIHLGHNRSVGEVVQAALQEGAQGICMSSYQGGHMEYFKYMKDLLNEAGADYVQIFGGGGGVIVQKEKEELEAYGVTKIFRPEDGRKLGIEGMIAEIMVACDFDVASKPMSKASREFPDRNLGLALTQIETGHKIKPIEGFERKSGTAPLVLGVTGTGGAGKSSLVDELLQRFANNVPDVKIGVICVDPSKRKTGGALLGDRIRMNSLSRPGLFMRSVASRGSGREISESLIHMLDYMKSLDFDLLIAETSGIGQASFAITEVSDLSLYVMTSEFGAQSQLEKIDMIDYADFIAINKADHRGAKDAFRDVRKQYERSHNLFHQDPEGFPVYLTQASNFNDRGLNRLFEGLSSKIGETHEIFKGKELEEGSTKTNIVPPERQAYLAEVVSTVRKYKKRTAELTQKARALGAISEVEKLELATPELKNKAEELKTSFTDEELENLMSFEDVQKQYSGNEYTYTVRGKEIKQNLTKKSLAGIDIPRVVYPEFKDWGERFKFLSLENAPGSFPYTAGVFPLKRLDESPARQFAGEGPPEKTNKRFHFLSKDTDVKRLSTAFDSVTLYGHDPHTRPDIFGKVGESGVSIASLDDMKRLYDGFDLCDPKTSVSMTINGPAPMILAYFMNTAIDQSVSKKEEELGRKLNDAEYAEVKKMTLTQVRGTVQADILKEDQGQNTCIFSTDFALKMMGDIQEYFTNNSVRNFYSVSISGYHIAEAGANPVTQLALTLSNAFTYVEYYLSRGLSIDSFASSLSFFFSNGLDPEYSVIGRVARRIWAVTLRDLYKAGSKSQKLKYHIQTSGRSLHSQEMDFNDIRTTLQALIAITDNCNSLHTNAYDEAITTPTEESVRRAQAIQLIVNQEFGQIINENSVQGSYFYDWMTDKVEEAVLEELLRINERGGVLGAMESQYQRGKIQEESMYYETLKHNGDLPIIGVNTFLNPATLKEGYVEPEIELRRSSREEKDMQLARVNKYKEDHSDQSQIQITKLKNAALAGENIFEALMDAARVCSLHQMSEALFEVGGQYRRNL